jgi:hypothetical protein
MPPAEEVTLSVSAVRVPSGAVVVFAVTVALASVHVSNSSDRMHRFVRCGSKSNVWIGALAPVGVT